ncbi:MAG: hypothetical protein A3G32_00420 [Deltaproteobacteria bacterium RIFCSPLOWO2_12_FULL_40_28]|nr:MAG: hypothetical protein A3C45_03575 [Deltaproteobacteria bacterium RIFCSPHIGHO2_02_FULL_40_28]OGQ19186.1 MAG: hypothetical protein A3E27_02460 [Deltaproteobacteria bacterium RIFCSPHIGHO2_12_FULL_40_32]OGQ39802.1 MAG: hypothetical protein A3I69_07535 [Deltaproteobacteria bacterium RIFCSPLOWO2_02_FULL_40_36]OGQ53638.1 MAG: hypothetical protein A3G32_00420 [Deltaproteobacteria bacterium RIFCSPLOWO2_12_FULL_40_28]
MKKKKSDTEMKGFEFYRTDEELLDYMAIPADKKLRWLEDMWNFNKQVALKNPQIAKIQEMFRRGEL